MPASRRTEGRRHRGAGGCVPACGNLIRRSDSINFTRLVRKVNSCGPGGGHSRANTRSPPPQCIIYPTKKSSQSSNTVIFQYASTPSVIFLVSCERESLCFQLIAYFRNRGVGWPLTIQKKHWTIIEVKKTTETVCLAKKTKRIHSQSQKKNICNLTPCARHLAFDCETCLDR